MRLRRLQRQDETGRWYDDAYAFEDDNGKVEFRYNLTWDRVGSAFNAKLSDAQSRLDEIETILQPGEGFRWLPVETIPAAEADALIDALDEACDIPKPRRIVSTTSTTLH